jgi:energy-coupling factor transporter transmembrane protein EcfT
MTPSPIDRRWLRFSAQEIDPLSWFTGSLVPLVFGALNLLYGGTFAILTWGASRDPLIQIVGVALCSAACIVVHLLTRPMRRGLGWGGASSALALGVTGFALSAVGYADTVLSIELWWAPFGLALVIASLGPYLPARAIILLGTAVTVIALPIAHLLVQTTANAWGPVSTAIIITSPLVSGIVATTAFSIAVVGRMLPLIERRSQTMLSVDSPRGARNEQLERERLARLISRAAPFIEDVARAGKVTAADRTLAGNLARRLRDDLVTQSNLSWLDSVAQDRLVVVDPDSQARRMSASQRTALRALIRAILDTPGTDAGSLLVELRAHPDGSTAVGVSLDFELPEGRRVMQLAPYYLALRGSVEDLEWSDDKFLRVTFNLPPSDLTST